MSAAAIALLYNPIFRVHLEKEVWMWVNAGTIVLFLSIMAPWSIIWKKAEKKGYSGTAIFAKNEPLSVSYGPTVLTPSRLFKGIPQSGRLAQRGNFAVLPSASR